jgi:hypothetical protein
MADDIFSLRSPDPIPEQGNPTVDDARARAMEGAKTIGTRGRKRRGATADSGVAGASVAGTSSPQLEEEIRRQLEQCYNPKTWGALLAAPADLMLTVTGKDYWDVKDRERDILGETGATAARFIITQNPKTLALIMLGSALFSVYVPRMAKQMRDDRAKKKPEVKPDGQA